MLTHLPATANIFSSIGCRCAFSVLVQTWFTLVACIDFTLTTAQERCPISSCKISSCKITSLASANFLIVGIKKTSPDRLVFKGNFGWQLHPQHLRRAAQVRRPQKPGRHQPARRRLTQPERRQPPSHQHRRHPPTPPHLIPAHHWQRKAELQPENWQPEPKRPPGDAKGLQTTNAEFVRKLIAALVGSVLEPLDTLQELADALGNDPNFATTVLNKLAGKQPLDETLTALSGKSVDGLIEYVGLRETISRAADALQKSQNGGDIPDKDLFVCRIGAARAFDGAVIIGCDDNPWTTAEFIVWLESQGAFNHPYWMCRGSWSYAYNKIITDTGCGNICLAGAVIEVMGVRGAMTIRVTTSHSVSGW